MRSLERSVFEAQEPFVLNHHGILNSSLTPRCWMTNISPQHRTTPSESFCPSKIKNQSISLRNALTISVQRSKQHYDLCLLAGPNQDLQVREAKPTIVRQQCIVYQFKCNLCDAGYVGYTRGHMHEHVDGHKRKASSIYKHYKIERNALVPKNLISQFHMLTKCKNKFECLVKEMLFIRRLVPDLNVQTDSIHARVFV